LPARVCFIFSIVSARNLSSSASAAELLEAEPVDLLALSCALAALELMVERKIARPKPINRNEPGEASCAQRLNIRSSLWGPIPMVKVVFRLRRPSLMNYGVR